MFQVAILSKLINYQVVNVSAPAMKQVFNRSNGLMIYMSDELKEVKSFKEITDFKSLISRNNSKEIKRLKSCRKNKDVFGT